MRMDTLGILKSSGFERKVYEDQEGKPVFFTKVFSLNEVPRFKAQYETNEWDSDPDIDTVVLEVSEDGQLLQYTAGIDYMESINPIEEPEKAEEWLKDFGLIQ